MHRPFKTIDEILFHEQIVFSKFNKKALDALTRSGAMNSLIDSRFTGMKHFWSAAVVDRPKTPKKFLENIDKYKPEGDFSDEEKLEHMVSLTGVYPINMVMTPDIIKRLEDKNISAIGDYEPTLGEVVWFIPRSIEEKKTKNGKVYWLVSVTDTSNKTTIIKCWGIDAKKDKIWTNRPYLAKLDFDEQWGWSTRSIKHTFKLLG
jgi:DNA polymerase III alpha subunit